MVRIGKDQLIKLQKKYPTDSSIAQLYGISRQAIQRLRTKYGIPPGEPTRAGRNAEIRRLRLDGMTVSFIAQKFGISETHIYRIIDSDE